MAADSISPKDRDTLRSLASRVRQLADDPKQHERARLWTRHNDLHGERPMVLIEVAGIGKELPLEATCEGDQARGIERALRLQIYQAEVVDDDNVVQAWWNVPWQRQISDFGVEVVQHRGEHEKLGSAVWDAPLKDLPADLARLHPRRLEVDREGSERELARMAELFDGILPVRRRGAFQWTQGMTIIAIRLIGLQELMMYMYDQPEGLHQLMAFLRDDHLAFNKQLEDEGLLTLNNESDYIGSGSQGWTDDLPRDDHEPGQPARLRDLWALSESQETVGVGPDLFEEFIFPYQLPVIEQFGLSYYGCCEPVHSRWDILKRIPNLRKVSISPWCDEEKMAAELGRAYVYCRKPNPTLISCAEWNETAILNDLRRTLEVAGGCNLEFAMKDVHTVADQPWRLRRWVELARKAIEDKG